VRRHELRDRSRRSRAALRRFVDNIDVLRHCARNHGYALAVHGSLLRDIDLVAVPWTSKATRGRVLKDAMEKLLLALNGGKGVAGSKRATRKPHGRRTYVIHFGDTYIDLSIMPRRT
jgi:hypothetical protein